VVFIHGLWLLPSSWDRWGQFFSEAGYALLTPDWPDDPETVQEAGANPDVLAKKTLTQVADHTTEIINAMDKRPAVLGHSTGGLLAQMLAGGGLSAATVAIDPGIFRGVLPSTGLRAQAVGPVPNQSAHTRPRDHPHVRPALRPGQAELGRLIVGDSRPGCSTRSSASAAPARSSSGWTTAPR
jgi:pimeloyl-ACP methyl ester carboxylesterase